jgi:hypothetical protein
MLAYLSLIVLPINPDIEGIWRAFPGNLFLDGWARWDAGWYSDIAENGYSDQAANAYGQRNVAFFPLYPLCIRVLNLVFRNSFLSGLIVSNLALVAGLILLYQLVRARYGEDTARWSLLFLMVYPFSFYFSTVYTEALFFLAVVGAFYFGERRRWFVATLCAAIASAIRITGFTVMLGLGILYLEMAEFDFRRIHRDVLWLLLAPTGLVLYIGFLWYRFGDPLLFVSSHQVAGWQAGVNFRRLAHAIRTALSVRAVLTGGYAVVELANPVAALAAIVLILLGRRRLRLAHSAWALALILASMRSWVALGRYVLPAFPVFVSAALLVRHSALRLSILYVGGLLLSLFAILFTHWYWVA